MAAGYWYWDCGHLRPGPIPKRSRRLSNNVLTAMEAFINSGESGVDPVCTAAAEAYIDAKIANSSDEDALTSAASAYIAAVSANPGAGQGCLDAASQFIGN